MRLATVYAFTALRLMRWWAMLTPLKTGWGTRESVEVRLADVTVPAPRRPAVDMDGPTRPLPPIAEVLAGARYWDAPTTMLPVVGRPLHGQQTVELSGFRS